MRIADIKNADNPFVVTEWVRDHAELYKKAGHAALREIAEVCQSVIERFGDTRLPI